MATNAAGALRLRFGAPRDMVLGMKIATAGGKIIKTGGRVVKNVTGYDVGKLLIGSCGTLGVIVEVSLKLFPQPVARTTFALKTGTLGIARDLRRRILVSPLSPLRMVLLDATAATLARRGTPLAGDAQEPEIWIEVGGSAGVIRRFASELEAIGRAAGSPLDRWDTEAATPAWDRVSDTRSWLSPAYPNLILLKASLPDSASEEFVSRAAQEAENEKLPLASFIQLGVGIVRLAFLEEQAASDRAALIVRLRGAAEDLGGALIVEHCPTELKSNTDAWGAPGDDFELLKRLKATWDPKGTLSPGRFVGGL